VKAAQEPTPETALYWESADARIYSPLRTAVISGKSRHEQTPAGAAQTMGMALMKARTSSGNRSAGQQSNLTAASFECASKNAVTSRYPRGAFISMARLD
jgi:hypothetical protein